MKIRRHLKGALSPDIIRQTAVQCVSHLISRHPGFRIKDCYISQGVYARIRAARSDNRDLLTKQSGQLPVQDAFYRLSILLYLPAAVACSVIGYRQKYPLLPPERVSACSSILLLRMFCGSFPVHSRTLLCSSRFIHNSVFTHNSTLTAIIAARKSSRIP